MLVANRAQQRYGPGCAIPNELPAAYVEVGSLGDAVVFDDSAAGNFDVAVAVGVTPAQPYPVSELPSRPISPNSGIRSCGNVPAEKCFPIPGITRDVIYDSVGGAAITTRELGP